MIGSLINAVAILLGGGVGLLLKNRISQTVSKTVTQAVGLCVAVIGIYGAVKGDFMLMIVSLALGALVGSALKIEDRLESFGNFLQAKFSTKEEEETGEEGSNFAKGFITATLLFCVGAMAIVGALESGLIGNRSILYTKTVLDGISAMILASTLGWGVLLSVVPLLIYQGGIELLSGLLQGVLTENLIVQISAVGSVMVFGIGINLILGSKIKTANFLPCLLVSVGYYFLFLK
ncbi:MAG: DUF554 domain-containing protein [Firmicutes bacterium]|nr:DUF554 domain-containing protein [Bacillota bacterium]